MRILVWHEIANDRIGDLNVAVTYCPLCGTAMAFDRAAGERVLTFGVSGLLYNSDVLIPYVMVYWFAWQAFYPETQLWNP